MITSSASPSSTVSSRKKLKSSCLSNGENGFKDKLLEMPEGVTIVKRRKGTRSKVKWFKLTAVEILEEAEIKCQWIPVFPVYGDEIDIEGKVIRSGLIRHAKDPVRMYNYWMTKATEEVALRGLAPVHHGRGAGRGHEEEFAQANNRAFAYLTYKPTALKVNCSRRRSVSKWPMYQLACSRWRCTPRRTSRKPSASSMQGSGQKSNETSGKAILARQREGDLGSFHYTDNLNLARRQAGRCIISMLPHYYDTERACGSSVRTARYRRPRSTSRTSPEEEQGRQGPRSPEQPVRRQVRRDGDERARATPPRGPRRRTT
jgi:hypothetical protein